MNLSTVPPITSKTSAPQHWHIPPRTHGIKRRAISQIRILKVARPDEAKRRKSSSRGASPRPRRRHATDGVNSTLYNPIATPLSDLNCIGAMTPTLETEPHKPLFLQLTGNRQPPVLVECKFGDVPRGSVLSYQTKPVQTSHDGNIIKIANAPNLPPFDCCPLQHFFQGPLTQTDSAFFDGLDVNTNQSHEYEQLTRNQSECPDWHRLRENRLTASVFKRVTGRKSNEETLAKDLTSKKTVQTAAMAHGIASEGDAARAYADKTNFNVYTVGIVINPSCVHLACSPDRRVYDPSETPNWGLLEIKCPMKDSFTEVKYLSCVNGSYKLKKIHNYYVQVMGQMGLTGSKWCDFFVWTANDYHLERIYFDDRLFGDYKRKLDTFYFQYLLPALSEKKL